MDTADLLQIEVKITDKAAMERLTPDMVTRYLSRHHWFCKRLGDPALRATEWWKGDAWLLVPMAQDVRDYGLRMASVVHEVGRCEKRSELAIYVHVMEGT